MPGQFRWSVDRLGALSRDVASRGIPSVMLFGLPDHKDDLGSGAFDADGIVQRAVRTIKDAVPELVVITDTCLAEYTSHGHCGIVRNGDVDNDATIVVLAQVAIS